MRISVIIPVLNEEKSIGATIAALKTLAPHEILIVDGGSTDQSCSLAAQSGARLIHSGRGRALQMNRGAKEASGEVLLFLHADTRLPPSAISDIHAALSDPRCVGGRFDVRLEGNHWMLKVIGDMISLRSRMTKVGTGDQAIFARRETFEALGGFPVLPLMEDIAFCRKLKASGEIACLKSRVLTSGRRWEKDGVWRTIIRMWILKILYFAGVSPVRLKQYYADTR